MTKLPDFLKRGEEARLIPTVADVNREQRAVSILLATFRGVREFRNAMLASLGIRAGNRADIQAWTEVVFHDEPPFSKADRPDGLIVLNTGKKQWKAIVEAKIGNAEIGEEQIKSYLQIAKQNKIDAVITISNQFVAIPTHHPIKISKSMLKGIELYHWSWMYVLTQATLLSNQGAVESADQRFILDEVIKYLAHDSSGISRFDSMNKEWKELVGKVKSGAPLNKSSDEVINTVSSWHQEHRDLCLLMSRKLSRQVRAKISRVHSADPIARVRDDSERLVRDKILNCCLDVPDAAADIDITADLTKRTITCSMKLSAALDRKSTSARVNWLTRQLGKVNTDGMFVRALRPGRSEETLVPLAVAMENAEALDLSSSKVPPTMLEIFYMVDLAGRFSGNKIFIDELEKAVPFFYEQVGQKVRPWIAPPPKISKREAADQNDPDEFGKVVEIKDGFEKDVESENEISTFVEFTEEADVLKEPEVTT